MFHFKWNSICWVYFVNLYVSLHFFWHPDISVSLDMSLSKLWELVMDREAWRAAVQRVPKSWTWLSNWTDLSWHPSPPWGTRLQEKVKRCYNWAYHGGGVLVAKLCLTLWDSVDCGLPGCSVHGISRQASWNGLPFPPSRDLPNPGIEPTSPALQADSLLLSH